MADVETNVPARRPPAKAWVLAQKLAEELGRAAQRRISALVGKRWFWFAAISIIFLVPLGSALRRTVPTPPRKLYELPAFSLLNERGERFGSEDLRGRIWVADFIFTSCAGPCPKLTKRMAEIQHRVRNMGDAIRLVTFSVDPENDTPERLAEYAKTYHANPRRWTFLTGPLGDVQALAMKGFKEATGKEELAPGTGMFEIAHSERLVLVDPEGWIRGYYDSTDEGVTEMLHDAGILANVR